MPTYDYSCKKCGHTFEKFQNMTSPPLKRCPRCKGALIRLIGSGAGLIFKGKGFYQTDYKPSTKESGVGKEKPETVGNSTETSPCGKTGTCATCPDNAK